MDNKGSLCVLCGNPTKASSGAPWLCFKDRPICFHCYMDLINEIYAMRGMGDGGLIVLMFIECLRRDLRHKHRASLKQNKQLFQKLCEQYNFECAFCKSKVNLTVDHIKPVSKGGTDNYNNLQILCKSCNSKKGAKYEVV